jgi:hypothetical protein
MKHGGVGVMAEYAIAETVCKLCEWKRHFCNEGRNEKVEYHNQSLKVYYPEE